MKRIKPMLFNGAMVRATLDDRKTATRRVIKPQIPQTAHIARLKYSWAWYWWEDGDGHGHEIKTPYRPGDILYARETWYYETHLEDRRYGEPMLPSGRYLFRYIYRADDPNYPVSTGGGWRPSIHMPKEAARIFLRVKDVRVERLQNITPQQIDAEGCKEYGYDVATGELVPSSPALFKVVWNSTIKPAELPLYGWDANPWVWVIEFERISREEAMK